MMQSKDKEEEEKNSKASIIFMIFGIGLVISSLFVFESKKGQASFSSLSPNVKTPDMQTSTDYKAKLKGIEITNQRISAEVNKDQELQNIGNKSLEKVEAPEALSRGVALQAKQTINCNFTIASKKRMTLIQMCIFRMN